MVRSAVQCTKYSSWLLEAFWVLGFTDAELPDAVITYNCARRVILGVQFSA